MKLNLQKSKRGLTVFLGVLLTLQAMTFGLFAGPQKAMAATSSLAINTPLEGSTLHSLNVNISGTATLANGEESSDYRVGLFLGNDETDQVSTLSGVNNAWSIAYSFETYGTKNIAIALMREGAETAAAWKVLNFEIIPQTPGAPGVAGELSTANGQTTADFHLDWAPNAEAGIQYKAGHRKVGTENFIFGDPTSLTQTDINGLEVNTAYEFTVMAIKGTVASQLSPFTTGKVETTVSHSVTPEVTNNENVPVNVVHDQGTNGIDYVELYYNLAEDSAGFEKWTTPENLQGKFLPEDFPIDFVASTEGTYYFYTVAYDQNGFSENHVLCPAILEGNQEFEVNLEEKKNAKCVPDSKTLVDFTAPVIEFSATPDTKQVDLTWEVTDNLSGVGEIVLYKDGEFLATVDLDTTMYTDTHVVPGATYTYKLAAKDKAGNGAEKEAAATLKADTTAGVPTTSEVQPTAATEGTTYQAAPSDQEVAQGEGEVKSDKDEEKVAQDENAAQDKNETKERRNVPLWGIVFLILLAGIAGYLFYSQGEEKSKK